MSLPLHVLLLEDNPSDAELMIVELRRAGFEPDWKRVETESDFLAALDPALDLILADYRLPQFDGLRALNLLLERKLEIPFIVVSGKIGEELAVQAMKKGAADYLLKDRLQRLGPAVQQALARKQAEDVRRKVERQTSALVGSLDDVIIEMDDQGTYLNIWTGHETLLAKPRAEMLGRPVSEILGEELSRKVLESSRRVLASGQFEDIEYPLDVDGGQRWFLARLSAIHPPDGAAKTLCMLVRDITERKRAEQELLKLRKAVEASGEVIFMTDRDGLITFVNPEFTDLYGYTAAEVVGMSTPRILKGGLIKAEHYERFWQTLLNKQVVKAELINKTKDGRLLTVEASANPILDERREIVGFLAIERDITERKQSQEEFSTIIKTAMDGFWKVDTQGRFLDANDAYSQMIGYSREELLNMHIQDVEAVELPEETARHIRTVIETGSDRFESRHRRKDGGFNDLEVSAKYLPESGGRIFVFIHDITKRKQAEEEIRHRLSQLEVLYAGSLAIGQLLAPREIGWKVLEILSERLDWPCASIHIYHRENDTIEPLVFHQSGLEIETERLAAEERFKTRILHPGQGFVGWVIQHGRTVYCGEVTKDSRYLEAWPGMNSGMYVPMKAGESVIGCLSVESERVDAFGETDEWLLTTLATQAASALENARLLEETSRRLKRVQALHTIDMAISSSLDLNLTIDIFLDEVVRHLGVDAADVLRLNPHTQTLEYLAGHGFRTDALQHTRLRLGEGYAGTAGLERRTIHIPDLQNRNTDVLRSRYFSSEGFETCFCVPLIAKGQLKGVLEVFHRTSLDNIKEEWLEFLETLAGQAALAIDSISLFEDLSRSNIELSLAYDSTIEGWSHALDLRDKETEGHTLRVTEITQRLAKAAGVGDAELIHIRRGALLHDIGKIGVPDGILFKPDKLMDDEWKVMRLHPQVAYDMLSPIAYLKPALDIPYCHHEKWDGTGYPRGLKGQQIPLAARLFAVVDVWDALRSDRPYRKAWPEGKVLEYIKAGSGTHFDPRAVELFLNMMNEQAHEHGQGAG